MSKEKIKYSENGKRTDRVTKKQKRKMQKLKDEGSSNEDIALEMKRNIRTVRSHLNNQEPQSSQTQIAEQDPLIERAKQKHSDDLLNLLEEWENGLRNLNLEVRAIWKELTEKKFCTSEFIKVALPIRVNNKQEIKIKFFIEDEALFGALLSHLPGDNLWSYWEDYKSMFNREMNTVMQTTGYDEQLIAILELLDKTNSTKCIDRLEELRLRGVLPDNPSCYYCPNAGKTVPEKSAPFAGLQMSEAALRKHHKQMATIASEVWDILEKTRNREYVFEWANDLVYPSHFQWGEQVCIVPTGRPESVDGIDWERFCQHMRSKNTPQAFHEWRKKAQALHNNLDSLRLRFVKGAVANAISTVRLQLEESFRSTEYRTTSPTTHIDFMIQRLYARIYASIIFNRQCDEESLLMEPFVKLGGDTPNPQRIPYRDVLLEHMLPDVKEALRILLDQCREQPEVVRISQLNSDLRSLFPQLDKELRLIIDRDTISGNGECEVCRGS